jgi:CIC family chloride channel protein
MIAAATGALVSEIVLDETVLLNFKQQQVFDYHKILYPSRILTGFMSVYYTRYFQRTEHYFGKLKLNAYKALLGIYISCFNFIFPTFLVRVMKVSRSCQKIILVKF